jgi:mono/diheme cytochrome c family protein
MKLWILFGLLTCGIGYYSIQKSNEVDYNSQVKPILNKHCIACHGGVKQAAGFSVLFREDALAKTKSGKPAIIVGDAAHSEFIKRLTHSDPDERMPYRAEALKEAEIEILTKWINQGLKWEDHYRACRSLF